MIIINIDVMLAKRKMSVTELTQRVGLTMANVSLIKNGKVIMHDKKKEVINSVQFQALNINKPVIYSIFKQLQNQTLISNRIPVSTKEAI